MPLDSIVPSKFLFIEFNNLSFLTDIPLEESNDYTIISHSSYNKLHLFILSCYILKSTIVHVLDIEMWNLSGTILSS